MKSFVSKSFFLILVLSVLELNVAISQVIEGLNIYPENVETLMDNTQTIISDPISNGNSIEVPGASETDNNFTLPTGGAQLGLSTEVGFSSMSKYIKVPLSVSYKNYSLSLLVPFYIQRKAQYSHGFESAYGLGDINLKLSYKYQKPVIFDELSAIATFPTGNENKTVHGYIVPLGTGSFDFIFSNTFQYRHARFRVYNNLSYRLSGKCKRNLTLSANYYDVDTVLRSGNEMVNYITSNGNLFSCNTSFDYPLFSFMSLHAGFAIMNSSSGTIYQKHTYSWNSDFVEKPEDSANQKYTSIDVRAAIAFTVWGTDLMVVVAQPVYVNTLNQNIKDSQKFNFYVRLSKKIF